MGLDLSNAKKIIEADNKVIISGLAKGRKLPANLRNDIEEAIALEAEEDFRGNAKSWSDLAILLGISRRTLLRKRKEQNAPQGYGDVEAWVKFLNGGESDNSLKRLNEARLRILNAQAAEREFRLKVLEGKYIVANFPGPCLWLSQTDADAKDQAEARLHKLFSECDAVKKLFPADRHKKKTQTVFFSNGMTLWVLGAHAKSNLQSRSIRWLIGDETWQWPSGHMQQAEARVTAFGWLGKCIFLSQGGTENDDTHRKFETTDMREWEFKCPKCGKYQPYKWSNIEWDKKYRDGGGQIDFAKVRSSVRLVCEFCKHEIADSDANRKLLNSSAKFVPQNPNAPATKAGFHWNSLASMSWGELAEMYLRAKESCRRGDMEDLKNFYQKRLALPWGDLEEDFTLDISPSGYRMGDDWESEAAVGVKGAILPPPHENKNRVRLRFLTVDVQMDHFYAVVRSWACDASSRLVYCAKLQTWEDVEILQNRFGVFPQLVFVDAGYAPPI